MRYSTIKKYRTLILHEVYSNYKIKDRSNCNNFNLYPRGSYIVECDETIKLNCKSQYVITRLMFAIK